MIWKKKFCFSNWHVQIRIHKASLIFCYYISYIPHDLENYTCPSFCPISLTCWNSKASYLIEYPTFWYWLMISLCWHLKTVSCLHSSYRLLSVGTWVQLLKKIFFIYFINSNNIQEGGYVIQMTYQKTHKSNGLHSHFWNDDCIFLYIYVGFIRLIWGFNNINWPHFFCIQQDCYLKFWRALKSYSLVEVNCVDIYH